MKSRILGFVLILAIFGCSVIASAVPLAQRHTIGIGVGPWGVATEISVEALPGSATTSVGQDGLMGELCYGYWLQEDLALSLSLGIRNLNMETKVSLTEFSSRNAYLGSLLFGLRYYLPASTRGGSVRPYVGGGVGMFHGSQDDVVTGMRLAVTSRSDQTFGGRVEVGVDFVLGRHFLTGLGLRYNLMDDFAEPIAGSRNFSGPEFGIGFGILFGQGQGGG